MKKIYVAPLIETIHVGIPSILAGTTHENEIGNTGSIEASGGGIGDVAGDDEEGLSRRGGGFWDDDF